MTAPGSKTRLRRKRQRGSHDRARIEAILDEALVAHLGVIDGGGFPVVTPTLHARAGAVLYVHGAAASRTLRAASLREACLTATIVDGLVLARTAMHHSANYRSAMVFGRAAPVEAADEKLAALEALVEKLIPGRWADVRPPSERELRATSVLRMALDEASAKTRSGPPVDDEPDLAIPTWAGVIGLRTSAVEARPDPLLPPDTPLPPYLSSVLDDFA